MDAPPSPLLPRTVKCWDLGSQEEVGFLVEFFLTFLMNVNLYYLTIGVKSCHVYKNKKDPKHSVSCLPFHNSIVFPSSFIVM